MGALKTILDGSRDEYRGWRKFRRATGIWPVWSMMSVVSIPILFCSCYLLLVPALETGRRPVIYTALVVIVLVLGLVWFAIRRLANKADVARAQRIVGRVPPSAERLAEIRTISHLLHPPLLDESGLSSAATWFSEGFEKRSGIKVEMNISLAQERLPQLVEMALFRALQESLSNVHRHSGSSKVQVRIQAENGQAALTVRDYGRGVSPDQLEGFEKGVDLGIGLVGMRERVSELGGKFRILSETPGMSVTVTIPTTERQAWVNSSVTDPEERGSAA